MEGLGAGHIVHRFVHRRLLAVAIAIAAAAVTVGSGLDAVVAVPCPTPEGDGVLTCPVAGTIPATGLLRVVAAVDPATIEDYPAGDRTATETFAPTALARVAAGSASDQEEVCRGADGRLSGFRRESVAFVTIALVLVGVVVEMVMVVQAWRGIFMMPEV